MYKIKKDELDDNFEIYCFLCNNNEVANALRAHIFDDSIPLSVSLENIEEEGDNFILTYLKDGKEHVLIENKDFVLSQGMVNSGKYQTSPLSPKATGEVTSGIETLIKLHRHQYHSLLPPFPW